MHPTRQNGRPAFAIFSESICDGVILAWHDDHGVPVSYSTEREAQLEIAEMIIERLQQFIAGERDFGDASVNYDFVLPVVVLPDGSLHTIDGRFFGIETA